MVHLVPDSGAIGAGPSPDTGNFDHIAFLAEDFEGMRKHFTSLGIKFEARDVPGTPIRQMFFPDPNRVMIEINFPRRA